MSTYIVDPNSYTSGTNLIGNGWTNPITRSGTTFTVQGTAPNQVLRIFGNVAGTKIFGYDAVQGANDVEILVKFRLSSDFGKQGVVMLRYTGTSEATTKGYQASGSFISSAGQLAIDEGSTGYVGYSAWNYLANVTYWVRMRVNGSNQYAKVWTDGSAEPGTWTVSTTNSVQTSGTYNGLATYSIATGSASATIDYYYVSFGTNGDQAPSAQTSKTQVGNVRITQTTDKTQSGNVRITQTTDKTQVGNVRITATTDRIQLGNVRVTRTTDRTQSGNVRITQTTDKTQAGNIRITAQTTRNQIGSVWIGPPPVNRDQVGNVNIRNNSDRTQVGNVRITRTVDTTQQGTVRIQVTNDRTQSGNVRIAAIYDRTQTGNVRILQVPTRDQIGNVRIRVTNDRNQVGSVVVAREYFKDQVGNVRIVAGIDYRIKPVGNISPEIPKMGSYATRPAGKAESITGLVTSDKIKPVLHIDEYTTTYTDTTVLTDDPVALCDDPFALAGSLISVGERPDALRAVVDKGNISINKEQIKWQTTQQTTPALQTSTDKPLWPQTTTQQGIIKSTQKSQPSLNA